MICHLEERNLPFRRDNELFRSLNIDYYLDLVELVKFDPFFLAHINRYLSKAVCEEIIQLMAKKIKGVIVSELKMVGHFSFSVDFTLNISKTDQLNLINKYVSREDGLPIERCLTFLEPKDYSGEYMAAFTTD